MKIIISENEDNEDCAEFLGGIPDEMVSLYHELILLEKRLEKHKIFIQAARSELNENEEIVLGDKREKGVFKNVDLQRRR